MGIGPWLKSTVESTIRTFHWKDHCPLVVKYNLVQWPRQAEARQATRRSRDWREVANHRMKIHEFGFHVGDPYSRWPHPNYLRLVQFDIAVAAITTLDLPFWCQHIQ